jgi:L-ascorbate metabolism protein UlaG (beta-lactamase superfamily)
MSLAGLSVTWLGHGTFLLTSPGGRRIVVDPWLEGNPACPPGRVTVDAADLVLLTHGHLDHVHDAAAIAKRTGATVVGIFEAAAAKACGLLHVGTAIPMHYGTFPALAGRPEQLRELVAPLGVEVIELRPGETA